MSAPVTLSAVASVPQSSPSTPSPLPTPSGVGSQPTSIAAANPPNDSNCWESLTECVSSAIELLRGLIASALEGLSSGFGTMAGWFGNKATPASETTSATAQPLAEAQPPIPSLTIQDSFSTLAISDAERQKIFTLIHTMGGSWWTLISRKAEMERIGEEIKHVHPLKFLECIFQDARLPQDMQSIKGSSLTWTPFINGLTEKMRKEAATLAPCMQGFARSLNVNPTDIQPYFHQVNCEELIKFLIDVKVSKRRSIWTVPAPSPRAPILLPPPIVAPIPLSIIVPAAIETPFTPTLAISIDDLPFESEDNDILTALMTSYAKNTRAWLLWDRAHLALQWQHLGERHPLKLLFCLFSKRPLMNHLLVLSQYWGTKKLFMRGLTHQLSRLPLVEVRPYIDDFAQKCQLDPARTKLLVQNGNWCQIVEDLLQKHQERELQ